MMMVVSVSMLENNKRISQIKKSNSEYEQYLDKQILGTTVFTIIHKAINDNEKNEVEKDEKGFYLENETDSIKVEVILLQNETQKKTYPMETLQKVGMEGFIKNFNLITFQCSKIEYHESTKKVKKVVLEQLEQ